MDSESLDQAMAVLTPLTGGNRLVRIISHVSELLERIHLSVMIVLELLFKGRREFG